MRHTLSSIITVSLLILGFSTSQASDNIVPTHPVHIQGGPGIVTAVSATQAQLPPAAQQFLQRIYSRTAVGPVMHNIVKDRYNVELGDGTRITFDAAGKVMDIRAPEGDTLYGRAIQAIVNGKTYQHLEKAGLLDSVTGIVDAGERGQRILMVNQYPPEMLFDLDGLFVIMDY